MGVGRRQLRHLAAVDVTRSHWIAFQFVQMYVYEYLETSGFQINVKFVSYFR